MKYKNHNKVPEEFNINGIRYIREDYRRSYDCEWFHIPSNVTFQKVKTGDGLGIVSHTGRVILFYDHHNHNFSLTTAKKELYLKDLVLIKMPRSQVNEGDTILWWEGIREESSRPPSLSDMQDTSNYFKKIRNNMLMGFNRDDTTNKIEQARSVEQLWVVCSREELK